MIAVNTFIRLFGTSGSARAADLIVAALAGRTDVVEVTPPHRGRTRPTRLWQMIAWDRWGAAKAAVRANADIVVHPANTGCGSRAVKSILVMHDTMVLDHPQTYDPFFVAYARAQYGHSVRKATLVVTPSEHSKRRIEARWPGAQVRVINLPSGTAATQPLPYRSRVRRALVVASADKHKRLPLAVAAVAAIREAGLELGLDMVVRPGNDDRALAHSIATYDAAGEWVTVRAGVSPEELSALYASALVLVVSSLDEGYCLPAIEAAAAATPVIHLDRGAVPEVVDDLLSDAKLPDGARLESGLRVAATDEARWTLASTAAIDAARRVPVEDFDQNWVALIEEIRAW